MKVSKTSAKVVGDKLGVDWSLLDLDEFTMGMNEELEHRGVTRGNYLLTGRIVLDHLDESPDYYTRLKKAMK